MLLSICSVIIEHVLKNFAVLAGAVGGAIAVFATWYFIDPWGSNVPEWLALWSYGFALGCGATLTCSASGGTSVGKCVTASLLGGALTTATVVVLAVIAIDDDLPVVALPFAAFYLTLWIAAAAMLLLLAPAVVVTLTLTGGTKLAQTIGTRRHMS
jgi:hypothetical protein